MSKNELTYMNSLKMKLSVILGVGQMSLGVCMKALNSLYYKRYIDFIFEFIPQILLLLALFGFMDMMIIIKWLTNYSTLPGGESTAPSVITTMITMCLNLGVQPPGSKDQPFVSNQTITMQILLLLVIVCVPIMLFVKPIYENAKFKKEDH